MCRELHALRQSISEYAKGFDVHELIPSEARAVVRTCAQIEASISAIKSMAAAKGAEGTAWKQAGYRSAADQLAQETGITGGAAKRTLEAGKRMVEQPDVAQAALAGELSPDQAAAVSDGAAANPDKTKELINKAKESSLPELNEEVARTKAAATDLEARRRAIHAKRCLRRWTDRDGVHHAHLSGNPEDGIALTRVIDQVRRRLVQLRNKSDQPRESFEAIDHDALLNVLSVVAGQDSELDMKELLDLGLFPQLDSSVLAGRHTAGSGLPDGPNLSTAAAASEQKTKRVKKLAGSPAKVIVRVDLDVLLRGYPVEGELCEIKGYGPVPVSLIEDLIATGNTVLAVALMEAQQVKSMHLRRRRPNIFQKTALELVYPECAVRGCNAREGLQVDHREDWSKTHFTVFDLLDHLCRYHHKLKTNKGWALVNGRGKRDFVPPDDPRHPNNSRGHESAADPSPSTSPAPTSPADQPLMTNGRKSPRAREPAQPGGP